MVSLIPLFIRNSITLLSVALKIVKVRAEAMHQCNQRVASGMLTVRVNAKSKLDEAMAEARDISE